MTTDTARATYATLAGRLSLVLYESIAAKCIERFDDDLMKIGVGGDSDDEHTSTMRRQVYDGMFTARSKLVELVGQLQKLRYPELRFGLGRMVVTAGVGALGENAADAALALAMRRHGRGQWGQVNGQDVHVNESALRHGGKIVSRYEDWLGATVYVVTEADRSATTVMLASEY